MSKPVSSLPADAAARKQALDTNASFCVQAPAGSGKTELLTQRLLCLLACSESPEEILAFTFTRKAAGEMRDRLLNSLQQAAVTSEAQMPELSEHKRATCVLAKAALAQDAHRNWQLLNNPHRLRITTIDSFNHSLTAQLPLRASMGAAANITTDMGPVYARAIRSLFSKLDGQGALTDNLINILRHLHNDLAKAETMFCLLLEKRDQWLPLVMQFRSEGLPAHSLLGESLHVIVQEQLQRIHAVLQPELPEILRLVRYTAQHLTDHPEHPNHILAKGLPEAVPAQLPVWRHLVGFLLTADLQGFRKKGGLRVTQGFPGKSAARDADLKQSYEQAKDDFQALVQSLENIAALSCLQDLALLPDPVLADDQGLVLNSLLDVLPLLASELDIAMREAGMVDFTQTTLAALQALGAEDDPSELALKLDYRIQHILVDEFQDTSSVQFRLLELLTRGWQPGDGRSLFVVGDGMQSCYGFRNARVSLFMQARERGIGDVPLIPLDLEVNFRSDAAVVNCVNSLFSQAFPAQADLARGGVTYSHSLPANPVASTSGVHLALWNVAETDIDKAVFQKAEANAVAGQIAALQEQDSEQSIAILVRYRSHLKAIVPALRQHGIKFNATEIDPLLSYTEISDLFSLFRAVLNPADSPAWFALLRSPMVGVQLQDLQLLAQACNALPCTLWTLWQQAENVQNLSEDARVRLQQSTRALEDARRLHQQWPARLWLETLWLSMRGPDCVSSESVLPNIESFLTLLEQFDTPGAYDLSGFTRALEKAYGSVSQPGVRLTIQTIHKAKGLEYDAVLIPGLHRSGNKSDSPLLQWNEYVDSGNHTHPIFALASQRGADRDQLYDYLKAEAAARERYEATRLLYIAVTRAVRSAWLFTEIKQDNKGLAAPKNSLLATISDLLQTPPAQLKRSLMPPPDSAETEAESPEAPRLWQPLYRLPVRTDTRVSLFPAAPEPASVEPQHEQLLARRIGELVHLGLKALVEQGPQWLQSAGELRVFKAGLAPVCDNAATLQNALEEVISQLHTCAQGPDAQWLLHQPHLLAACELALVDYRKGYRRDFSIDRTFVDETGTRWVIDYKSSRPGPEQELDGFLAEQTRHYLPQLTTYAGLFAHEKRPVRLALYFTALARLHEITPLAHMDISTPGSYAGQHSLFGPEDN